MSMTTYRPKTDAKMRAGLPMHTLGPLLLADIAHAEQCLREREDALSNPPSLRQR